MSDRRHKELQQLYEGRVALIAGVKGIPASLVRAGLPFEVFKLEQARLEWPREEPPEPL